MGSYYARVQYTAKYELNFQTKWCAYFNVTCVYIICLDHMHLTQELPGQIKLM